MSEIGDALAGLCMFGIVVILLVWALGGFEPREQELCLEKHAVCIETTDGWKGYEG